MTKYLDPRDGKTYTLAEATAAPTGDTPAGPAWGYGSPPRVPSQNQGEGLITMPVVYVPEEPAKA